MTELFKALVDLGFTPLNCCLLGGLLTIWRVSVAKDRKQTEDREAWHSETRGQVDELKGHVKACDDDRQNINRKHAILKERFDRFSRCQRKDCPNRLP